MIEFTHQIRLLSCWFVRWDSVNHDRLLAPFLANQNYTSMTIQIRFFASLREQVGMADKVLEASDDMTVVSVWQQATGQPDIPANVLMAVNMEYVAADQPVTEGDEVAFFPPVTGG